MSQRFDSIAAQLAILGARINALVADGRSKDERISALEAQTADLQAQILAGGALSDDEAAQISARIDALSGLLPPVEAPVEPVPAI